MAEKSNEELLIDLLVADQSDDSVTYQRVREACLKRGRELLAAREPKLMTWEDMQLVHAQHALSGVGAYIHVRDALLTSVRAVLLHKITTEQPHSHPGKEQERIVSIINEVLPNG